MGWGITGKNIIGRGAEKSHQGVKLRLTGKEYSLEKRTPRKKFPNGTEAHSPTD